MMNQKRNDTLNIAAELYSIWGSPDRSQRFENFLRSRLCEEPWLCWSSISDFLEWIRNDTIGGVKQRNTTFIKIVEDFIEEGEDKHTINISEKDFREKLLYIKEDLKQGNDNEFDIRPIFELQAKTEILIAENLKQFLFEKQTDGETNNGKQTESLILDKIMELCVVSLFELQTGKTKRIYKKNRCVLNPTNKTLTLYNQDGESYYDYNVIDLKYVRFIYPDEKEKIKNFEIQYLTPTSQRIFYFKTPLAQAEMFASLINLITKERDEKIKTVNQEVMHYLRIPVIHPLNSFLEILRRHIQLKEESMVLLENQILIENNNESPTLKKESETDIFTNETSSDVSDKKKKKKKGKKGSSESKSKAISSYITSMPNSMISKYGNPLPKISGNNPNPIFSYSSVLPENMNGGNSDKSKESPRFLEWSQDTKSEDDSSSEKDENVKDTGILDFNGKFQLLIEKLRKIPDRFIQEKLSVQQELIHLSQDFTKSARRYGKIIISEVYRPNKFKTIKPKDVGGVIGGEKYIVNNILFKFAVDHHKLLGENGDAYAAKIAGHELKGLKAFFNLNFSGISFPLMSLIDYKGFRLIAVSLLPLSKNSLIYGSNDAGETIHREIPELNRNIDAAAKKLNLKPHKCGKKGILMGACVDLEGHRGTDGRFYMLDYSRTFPCVKPESSIVGGHLFRMFRPEFVVNFKFFPLCSDAYSRFIETQPDAEEHNREIDSATKELINVVIPNFARELLQLMEVEVKLKGTIYDFRLTEVVHSNGINMRYMGLIIKKMGRHKYKDAILVNMIARIIKNQIRALLRKEMYKEKLAIDEPYRIAVMDFLNLIFGNTEESVKFWSEVIVSQLKEKFNLYPESWNDFPKNLRAYVFGNEEDKQEKEMVTNSINSLKLSTINTNNPPKEVEAFDRRYYLFKEVQKMVGIKFAPSVYTLLKNHPTIYEQKEIFSDTDVLGLGIKMKNLDIISNAKGYVYQIKGQEKETSGFYPSAKSLYEQAKDSYEQALNSNPTDPRLLRNLASVIYKIYKLEKLIDNKGVQTMNEITIEKQHPLIITADNYFKKAIRYDRNSVASFTAYAKFLGQCGRYEDSEDHFLQILKKNPNNINAITKYAFFLEKIVPQARTSTSMQLYKRAYELEVKHHQIKKEIEVLKKRIDEKEYRELHLSWQLEHENEEEI
eukprot:TRINITY_DN5993_c0_g1_i1.p1 TRINITY_DN5993_c0_g1~~TRINITY_DN5993_c0_g1_i1.p1  ORF type:complete len:1174 (+),score=399.27 TRINITY_DN5993_c0_g1_i1:76-3597(+)